MYRPPRTLYMPLPSSNPIALSPSRSSDVTSCVSYKHVLSYFDQPGASRSSPTFAPLIVIS